MSVLLRAVVPPFGVGLLSLCSLALSAGCGGSGTLDVRVYGESFIEDGIPANATIDGWAIAFDTFLVNVAGVGIEDADGATVEALNGVERFDVATASDGEGQLVGSFEHATGPVDGVRWSITTDGDGCGVHTVGRATDGTSSKAFDWCFPMNVTYVRCATTAEVGPDEPAVSQLTVHGDHLFFDDLVSTEPNVAFALIASADDAGNGDGTVTRAELEATDITTEDRYQVGNANVDDLWAFIAALATQVGHIDGEGHCEQE